VQGTTEYAGRTALLAGLPPNIIAGLNRSNACITDMTNIITQLEQLGRLDRTGERPLMIIAGNALMRVEGTDVGRTIKKVTQELEQHYGGDSPSEITFPIPEIVIGQDERLSSHFLERAMQTGRSVTRLQVPRILDGQMQTGEYAFGTGWLVAPGLLFTNHHVIAARSPGEPGASQDDCREQAGKAIAWFDYHQEGGPRIDCECAELICSDETLDYALVRLGGTSPLDDRQPLSIVCQSPALRRGDRLNIVQHPRGGPLRYAIRSNFYVGTGDAPDYIRYLTDTEGGSSGSPVLNDSWQVIAMHHAYHQVPKEVYKGDVVKYHNQGIAIHAILSHLPSEMQREIEMAQGWSR
jgi:V8-like Glu-specific endopeptidase